jgi:hypothetical protein
MTGSGQNPLSPSARERLLLPEADMVNGPSIADLLWRTGMSGD